jgi:hypothetical protein
MGESRVELVERLEREYRATSAFGRYAHKKFLVWHEVVAEETLWLDAHPKAAARFKAPHLARRKKADGKQGFWRRRRDLSDRRKARRFAQLRRARKALARARRRNWRRQRIDWNGNDPHVSRRVKLVLRFSQHVRAFHATVTSTTGGTHASTSWHYQGRAADEVEDEMVRLQNALLAFFGAEYFLELFGPADWYVKNGVVYQGAFPYHDDHIHAAA